MMKSLEWNPDLVPPLKLGLHGAQILFSFIIFCLEISVFRAKNASIVGDNGWTFGVCFLSVPAWIYLCMAPRFPRTRRLANPYVMASIDGLFTVVWLSAFATQAAYNTADLCGEGCAESKAIVGMGFFVFLFFAGTTFISLYTVQYYKWNGNLPGYENIQSRPHNIDPDKAAFSMAPHDEEAYAPIGMAGHDIDHHSNSDDQEYDATHGGQSQVGGGYSDLGSFGRREGSNVGENPFRHDNPFDSDTEYNPHHQEPVGHVYAPPSVNDDYDDVQPVHFPAGNYERVDH